MRFLEMDLTVSAKLKARHIVTLEFYSMCQHHMEIHFRMKKNNKYLALFEYDFKEFGPLLSEYLRCQRNAIFLQGE